MKQVVEVGIDVFGMMIEVEVVVIWITVAVQDGMNLHHYHESLSQ